MLDTLDVSPAVALCNSLNSASVIGNGPSQNFLVSVNISSAARGDTIAAIE